MERGSEVQHATRVTCVIPTHDRLDLLRRSLSSVLAQSRAADRIVVVDDLNDDRVRAFVESFAQPDRIHYVGFVPDGAGTAGAARNAGAAVGRDPLIAFLDDDDEWDRTFLERQIAALEDAGADLAVCWNRFEREGTALEMLPRMPTRVRLETVKSKNPGLTGSNFVIRRSAFEQLEGFDASLPVFNDLDFLVRFVEQGFAHVVVPHELVTQFSHGGPQLSARSERRARGIRRYLAKHSHGLGLRSRRRLLREIYMTERYPGRGRVARVAYFLLAWSVAEPGDILTAVRRRAKRVPRAYR